MKIKIEQNDILLILFYATLSFFTIFVSADIVISEEATTKWYALATITILCCFAILLSKDHIIIEIDKLTLLLVVFVLYLFIRAFFGVPLFAEIVYLAIFVILFFIAKTFDHRLLPYVLITAGVSQSVIGIMQYYGISHSLFNSGISGTFDNTAGYASCLATTYPLCFLILKKSKYDIIFGIASMILIIIGILLSGSRAGILSIIVVSVIYILASLKKAKMIYIGTSVVVLITTFVSLFFFKVDSICGRLLIWETSLNLMKYNIIFGGGYGSFEANYMPLQGEYFANNPNSIFLQLADNVSSPFNEYIRLISEYGLVGLILFISFFVYMLVVNKKNNPYLLCIISLAIFSFFSYPFSYPFTLVIAAFCLGRLSDVFPYWRYVFNVWGRFSIMFVILCVMLIFSFKNVKFDLDWERAYNQSSFGKRDNIMIRYDSLYEVWNGNPKFLYNYAVELEKDGQSERSIEIMNECKKQVNDYDVSIFLAEVYLKNKKYDLSEQYYITAKNMVPNRFLPLGRLLRIYEAQFEIEKAKKIANEILSKEIKVPSVEVSWVIIEAKKFIEKQ